VVSPFGNPAGGPGPSAASAAAGSAGGAPAEAAAGETGGVRKDAAGAPPAALVEGLVFSRSEGGFRLEIDRLEVARGASILLSAPSGGGKSTLLALMAGILVPAKGSVSIAGQELCGLSGPARDRIRGGRIGFIFQQFNLVPYLSVLENVLLPLRLNPARRRAAEEAGQSAGDLLGRLGLGSGLWRRPASRISVGQGQRVAAARALIGRPPLILADEPTSALDEDLREEFLEVLQKECALAGAGLLLASHDRRLAARFGAEARLVERGGAARLELSGGGGGTDRPNRPPSGRAGASAGESSADDPARAFLIKEANP
jgi:putative ABC transport system ATP-binding protein